MCDGAIGPYERLAIVYGVHNKGHRVKFLLKYPAYYTDEEVAMLADTEPGVMRVDVITKLLFPDGDVGTIYLVP